MPTVAPIDPLSGSPTDPTAIIPIATLVQRVRKLLEDEPWEDVISTAVTTSPASGSIEATGLSLTQYAQWAEGDVLEFNDGTGEQVRITDTRNPITGNPVPNKRGHNDTTPATHVTNTIVLKNPGFGYDLISEALTRACNSAWPWVYATATSSVVPVSGTSLYAAPSDVMDPVDAWQLDTSTNLNSLQYGPGTMMVYALRNQPATVSASGIVWNFPSGFYNYTNPVNVTYRATLTTANIPDNDIAEWVCLKTCARLLGAKEIPIGSEDESYTPPPGVAPGVRQRTSAWFESQAIALRRQIRSRLLNTARPMRKWIT